MLNIFPVRVTYNAAKDKNEKVPALPKGTSWKDADTSAEELAKFDNFGIEPPKGVVVIDLDTQKGVTTADVEKALGCSLDWDDAALQETVSGGMHYAFATTANVRQGSDLLGVKGFDTRTAGKGWICTGKGYKEIGGEAVADKLEDVDFLPELPAEAVEALKAHKVEAVEKDDALEIAIANQADETISLEDVKAMLSKLPDEYKTDQDLWLSILRAVSHQTGKSEEGWEVFNEWSKGADNYDEIGNRKRWDSFKNDKTESTTIATLVHASGGRKAVEVTKSESLIDRLSSIDSNNGLLEAVKEAASLKLDEISFEILLKKLGKQFSVVTGEKFSEPKLRKMIKKHRPVECDGSFVEDYVFVTSHDEYMNRETKAVMKKGAFDTKHNRETPPTSQEGEKQQAHTFAAQTIECVDLPMYAPKFEETFTHEGIDYVNLYKPSRLKRVRHGKTNVVDRVKEHIAHILPDEREQRIFTNYLAYNVQNVGEKMFWSIVLQGVQGDGKSFFAEMMQHVLGIHNVRLLNVQTLESNFTGWATGQCMTFIEELKLDNFRKYEVLNNLKPYISNPTIEVVKKGKDPQTVMNTTNYVALTNFKDAIPIDDNDRRYCILFSQWQNADKLKEFISANPSYYPSLYDCMRENAGEILDWLLTWDIDAEFLAMTRAPETSAKEQMKNLSKSETTISLEDAIEEFECDNINDQVVNITKLQKLVESSMGFDGNKYDDFPQKRQIKNVMMNLGYHNIGRYKDIDGNNHTVYHKDPTQKAKDFK